MEELLVISTKQFVAFNNSQPITVFLQLIGYIGFFIDTTQLEMAMGTRSPIPHGEFFH
jgi:hypothetical protein